MKRRTPSEEDRVRVREALRDKSGTDSSYHQLIYNILVGSDVPLCSYEIASRIPSHIRSATNVASRLCEMILADIVIKTHVGKSPVTGKKVQFYDVNPEPPAKIEFKKPPAFWYIQYVGRSRYEPPIAIIPVGRFSRKQIEDMYPSPVHYVERLSFSSITP
jgi:hypothetical protein